MHALENRRTHIQPMITNAIRIAIAKPRLDILKPPQLLCGYFRIDFRNAANSSARSRTIDRSELNSSAPCESPFF